MPSSKNIAKAMLFAAGRGERLRPLTDKTPKPLLPIGEKPIIDYSLAYLKKNGVEEVVINLHHLGAKIKQHVGEGKKYGLRIYYSEEEKLLGTGGGLKKAEAHFKNETAFFTLNSDTLINCDLKELTEFHYSQNRPATLVVAPWQEGYTKIEGKYLFTGLAVWGPVIFQELTPSPSNLITGCGLARSVFVHDGLWIDIGTKETYQKAQETWAAGHHQRLA
ncbi:MAG: nucleotidyltransferase family protein [Deltaproteobacteria bacterium]|nr:nucleotidyltransferase family protein [Deltaproteobacteria bacterium]